jgi:hypothetical protein
MEDLTAKVAEAFDLMADGKPHARTELAAKLGYPDAKVQGFKKLLDRIKLKGYINRVDQDALQLSDVCFPVGRGD